MRSCTKPLGVVYSLLECLETLIRFSMVSLYPQKGTFNGTKQTQ